MDKKHAWSAEVDAVEAEFIRVDNLQSELVNNVSQALSGETPEGKSGWVTIGGIKLNGSVVINEPLGGPMAVLSLQALPGMDTGEIIVYPVRAKRAPDGTLQALYIDFETQMDYYIEPRTDVMRQLLKMAKKGTE